MSKRDDLPPGHGWYLFAYGRDWVGGYQGLFGPCRKFTRKTRKAALDCMWELHNEHESHRRENDIAMKWLCSVWIQE